TWPMAWTSPWVSGATHECRVRVCVCVVRVVRVVCATEWKLNVCVQALVGVIRWRTCWPPATWCPSTATSTPTTTTCSTPPRSRTSPRTKAYDRTHTTAHTRTTARTNATSRSHAQLFLVN